MIPLTVTAHLSAPCAPGGPLLLDGPLLAGLGASIGAARGDGWADQNEVYQVADAGGLALARVDTPHGWWWAASQAIPVGPEAVQHAHRRPAYDSIERWTTAASVNHSAGPDKALRVPVYTRSEWLTVTWTCVGDPRRIAALLAHVPGLGQRTTHGYGWVREWEIVTGGPPLDDYARSLDLRHLPAGEVQPADLAPILSRVRRYELPLRPPYHDRMQSVTCWQVCR